MPDTITIDTNARAYIKATSPDYQKQLDRGDTALGVAEIDGSGTVLPSTELGLSHLIKSHNRAGSGKRSSISIKDETMDTTTLIAEKNTVVVTFYGPMTATSRERLKWMFAGLSAFMTASTYAEIEDLLIGGISVPD